jgi:predicted ester cyclase
MAFGATLMPLLEKAGIPTDIPPTIAPLHNSLIQPAADRARSATNQIAFAAPVLPGKEEQAQAFFAALRGPRNREFVASRASLGIRERTYCQHTPQGDMCIVTLQGENAAEAAGKIGAGNDDFTIWFAQQVLDIHGLDLRQPLPGELPQVIVDSGSAAEHNKAVVRRFFEGAMNRHDPNILDEVAAPEYVNYLPVASGPLDLAASKGSLQEFFNAFPDLRWVDEGMIAEGDLIASRYTVTGTHRGTLMGIPATGRQIALHGTSLHKLKNGKIVEDWPGFSPLELLEQLGASPSMVPAGAH